MCEHPRQDISKHRILTQVILSVLTQFSRSLPNSTVGALKSCAPCVHVGADVQDTQPSEDFHDREFYRAQIMARPYCQ
jgi:hypothetical protein